MRRPSVSGRSIRAPESRARTCAPRGRGVGRWGPTSGRVGFGAQPRLTIDTLHSDLDSTVFLRVLRAHGVHISTVKEIAPWFSRNNILRMTEWKDPEIPPNRTSIQRLPTLLTLERRSPSLPRLRYLLSQQS